MSVSLSATGVQTPVNYFLCCGYRPVFKIMPQQYLCRVNWWCDCQWVITLQFCRSRLSWFPVLESNSSVSLISRSHSATSNGQNKGSERSIWIMGIFTEIRVNLDV